MLKIINENDFLVSKTDLKGRIIYCNQIFMDMAEYRESELISKPHNIIRHPDVPKAIFRYLWQEIPQKQEVFAYIINRSKNGNDYWVYANITASTDERGEITDYYSVRRKPNERALETIIPLYKQMIKAQNNDGIDASFNILATLLKQKGATYNEFIISLQEQ